TNSIYKHVESGSLLVVDDIDRLSGSRLDVAWEFLSELKSIQEYLLKYRCFRFSVLVCYSDEVSSEGFHDLELKLFDVIYHLPPVPLTESLMLFWDRLIDRFSDIQSHEEECKSI